MRTTALIDRLRRAARPLTGASADYDPLFEMIGDARFVLIGEASHGTHEFYRERARITKRLIEEKAFTAVTAASDWGGPAERKRVCPALPESYEALLHGVNMPGFLLTFQDTEVAADLGKPRLERAIGVIYRPDTERRSHYFHACLPEQFDALIHIDETRAVEPLERTLKWETEEVWETFPSGM